MPAAAAPTPPSTSSATAPAANRQATAPLPLWGPGMYMKTALVPKGARAVRLSNGAGDGKSKDLLRKSLFRCGPSALACCAGKCSRIFSASHPAGFDPHHPARLRKRLWSPKGARAVNLSCGAGDGNRTRVISLEGWGSTIELRPQDMVGTTGFEPATSCSQSRRATKLRHVPKVLSS